MLVEVFRMGMKKLLLVAGLLMFFAVNASAQMCETILGESTCTAINGCYWCPTMGQCYPFPDCITCEQMPQNLCANSPTCHWCDNLFKCILNERPCTCGDNVVQAPEECDGGANCNNCQCPENMIPNGNTTRPGCTLCGNTVLDAGEDCEGTPHCNAVCKCASGYIPDPANPGYCKAPQVCGNGILEGAEQCEIYSRNCVDCLCVTGTIPDPANPGYCVAQQVCGNLVLEGAEECDDGNLVGGDGCSAACRNEDQSNPQVVRPCGAGVDLCAWDKPLPLGNDYYDIWGCNYQYKTFWPVVTDNEVSCTFDGSVYRGHSLSLSVDNDVIECKLNGQTVVSNYAGEGCAKKDPRNGVVTSIPAVNGVNTLVCKIRDRALSEGINLPNANFFDACVTGNSPNACGDGVIWGAEECDDGNSVSGDGCSASCAVEAGFECDGQPSVCELMCSDGDGDGYSAQNAGCGPQDCDDANAAVNPEAVDVCNGLDDDCDGSVDEGDPGGGIACSTGLSGVCAAGTTSCSNGAIVCNQNQQPSLEVCNGLDDDCDSQADEELIAPLAEDQDGVCAGALKLCGGSAGWVEPDISRIPGYLPYEVPGNSVDENCDLTVLCDPQATWKNHGAFVSCVSKEAEKLLSQGLITESEKDSMVSAAAKTKIGKK